LLHKETVSFGRQYIKSSVKTTKGGESDDYMYTQKKVNRNKPGTFKKTSSPDVLYGRDFEDKFIQLFVVLFGFLNAEMKEIKH